MKFAEHSDEELKAIAEGLRAGTIFSDCHLDKLEHIRQHFLPIGLGCFSDVSVDLIKNIGLVYEYLDAAGPMDLNGKPVFMSLRVLSLDQADKVWEYMRKIEKAVAEL